MDMPNTITTENPSFSSAQRRSNPYGLRERNPARLRIEYRVYPKNPLSCAHPKTLDKVYGK
jgi:hypothetical protein